MKVFRDGAEALGSDAADRREYKRRTQAMAERQNNECAICRKWLTVPTFDHQWGRGHGGAFRDDRIELDGEWFNAALCPDCNHLKGSRRYHWKDGKYVPI
jgi:hypothetical protein